MNTRPTELRTYHDLRVQRELERLLAAKRADEAAREERYRRLRTPRVSDVQPEPETVPSWVAWALMCALSLLLTLGSLAFAVWLPRIWEAMS